MCAISCFLKRPISLQHSSLSPEMMRSNQKSKPHAPPRPLFSCGFFRRCTQSVLSPTSPHHHNNKTNPKPTTTSSSSSSSTSTSQSFTQWRFPHHLDPSPPLPPPPPPPQTTSPPPLPPPSTTLQETFQIAELHLTSVSESDKLLALQLLERIVVPDPPSNPTCPLGLMRGLVCCLRNNKIASKNVTKILLALCLEEGNRRVAVEAGAARAVVEISAGLETAAAERALAALELMCTVTEGATEVRNHAMTVPVMVAVMARLAGRGREYAMSILGVVYGSERGCGEEMTVAPAEEVARAVALALEGECTERGRRKGAQLLKKLEEYGRLDLNQK